MGRGEDLRIPLPIILGHEGVGEVAAIAGKVYTIQGDTLKEGDRISWINLPAAARLRLDPRRVCITCSQCTQMMRGGAATGCPIRDREFFGPIYKRVAGKDY